MSNLSEYLSDVRRLTKCGMYISFNPHRDYYESVLQYVNRDEPTEIPADVLTTMVNTDTVVEVQCYKITPIGSYTVQHHSLLEALMKMYRILEA